MRSDDTAFEETGGTRDYTRAAQRGAATVTMERQIPTRMKIHDTGLFALVVPTFEGTPYLQRMLDYFRHVAFEGRIVLADNSSGEHREFIDRCAGAYPELELEVHSFPHDIRFLDKMVATLEKLDARFVMLHAHDDFMVPDAVERCVAFLADNPTYGVVRGRVAMIALSRGTGAHATEVGVHLVPHPMRAYEQDDPVERVLNHVERYASTFYSVHRREHLVESFRLTEEATNNVIFFQYLSSCISVFKGKVSCSDELFYVRQGHEDSWSGSLKKGDYEHWPMLITSANFSDYYQEFRDALCRVIGKASATDMPELGARIDRAALGLFQRSFCGKEVDNPAETRFLQRLNDQASEENRHLTAVVQFAASYQNTF